MYNPKDPNIIAFDTFDGVHNHILANNKTA